MQAAPTGESSKLIKQTLNPYAYPPIQSIKRLPLGPIQLLSLCPLFPVPTSTWSKVEFQN